MRLTHVSLYANDIEAITFSLKLGTTHSKFEVRAMVGLDADELVPKFYAFGLTSRDRFYELGMNKREIVIRAKLNPRFDIDESYSDIRDDLYRVISASMTGKVSLIFNRDAATIAKIDGFITKFEVPHFTQLPEVQITVNCDDDPMLRGVSPIQYNPETFPTVNPVIMGDGLSTAPHGFRLRVKFTADEESFTIQEKETDPDWAFTVVPGAELPLAGFDTDDVLYISTDPRDRAVELVRDGVTFLLLDKVFPGSVWPIIFPGGNEFWFPEIGSIEWELIEYYPAYWGI